MIEINDLRVCYDRPALRGVSLHLDVGEYVLLTGPSGCGKSTLALCLNGIIPHIIPAQLQGSVSVAGLQTNEHTVAELARHVGLVFQNPATQLFNETVEEEIAFGPRNLGLEKDEVAASVERSLEAVGIAHLRQRPLRQLSSGEQQRVAIAAVLAMNPRLLVLDEPLANLDRQGVREVLASLDRLHQLGITIFLIEHRLEAVAPHVQRALIMDDGCIIADGPSVELLAERPLLDRLGLRYPRPSPDLWPKEDRAAAAGMVAFEPLVILEGIAANYGAHEVLRSVNLTIHQGEFLALVGENGAGKTTLARVLTGILRPTRGQIHWASAVSRLPLSKRVGMLSQNPRHQLLCDRVAEEISYGLLNFRLAPDSRLEALLAMTGLGQLRDRRIQSLSVGQQQRTALAAAMALSPRLLILDEPTLGQDWGHLSKMMDYLAQLNKGGQTILLITHDQKLVCRYAQRIVVMEKGRITADRQLKVPSPGGAHYEVVSA